MDVLELVDATRDRTIYARLRALYTSAFPPEERAPLWLLRAKARGGASEMLAALDGGRFAGLAVVVAHDELRYVFFLAVEESLRGRGYGTGLLAALRARYPAARMLLCMEDPDAPCDNREQRLRRGAFYARCGYRDTGVRLSEAGVAYALLSDDGAVTYDEYYALMRSYMGSLLSRVLYRRLN